MRYNVLFTPKAERMYGKLAADVQERLKPRIGALSANPRPAGCTKLEGPDNLYRIRVGDYRVIYEIQDHVLIVLVVAVGPRGEIYRKR